MKKNLSNGASHPRVGLALSGGASRGIAHVGVLQALKDNGVKIDFLSGTSIGAMVGALYAFGIPIEDIHRRAREMSWLSISSVKFSKTALLSNRVIGEIIEDFLEDANIEDALIPLAIVTTDISRGKKVILHSGNVSRAVMASTAIPGIFSPIYIDGRLLVDGFLVDNVPVSILKEMGADVTIGVNLGTLKEYREPKGIINIIMNAFDIAIDANTSLTSQNADVLIVPKLSEIELNDSMRSTVLYDEGYSAALFSLSKIKNVIQDKQRKTRKSFWRIL